MRRVESKELERIKGVYILLIKINREIQIKVGSLGMIKFEKGVYAYIGSAQNNLKKRVERHLRRKKRMHWHIDYLLNNRNVKILKVFYKKADKTQECKIAKELNKNETSIKDFGCSDCKCKSHLFKIDNIKNILKLEMKEI
jgi:Uri superfamily endonuclease